MEEQKPKTEMRRINFPLTEKERAELADSIAEKIAERDRKEAKKKSFDKIIGDEIKALDEECSELATQIREGKRGEDVECTVTYNDPEYNQKTYYRYPDGEVIETCEMSEEEIQRISAPLFDGVKDEIKEKHICKNCIHSGPSLEPEEDYNLDCANGESEFFGLNVSADNSCEHCTFSKIKSIFGVDPDSVEELKDKWFVADGMLSDLEQMVAIAGKDFTADVPVNVEEMAGRLLVFGERTKIIQISTPEISYNQVIKVDKKKSFYAFSPLSIEEEYTEDEPAEEDALHIPENVEEEL